MATVIIKGKPTWQSILDELVMAGREPAVSNAFEWAEVYRQTDEPVPHVSFDMNGSIYFTWQEEPAGKLTFAPDGNINYRAVLDFRSPASAFRNPFERMLTTWGGRTGGG